MNDTVIMQAAETLMNMCTDFRVGGMSQATFVSNLELFAWQCRARLNTVDSQALPPTPASTPCVHNWVATTGGFYCSACGLQRATGG
jgi:hypothetical protein